MSRCWAENSHERPEFDVIKTILHQAKDEFQDYDKSGEFRSLQVYYKLVYNVNKSHSTRLAILKQVFYLT